jgi:hypothetical protein
MALDDYLHDPVAIVQEENPLFPFDTNVMPSTAASDLLTKS